MQGVGQKILQGASHESDEMKAVGELADQIGQESTGLVVFFCAPSFDLDRLAAELNRRFKSPMIGCTTSGEIAGGTFRQGSLVGASLPACAVKAQVRVIDPLTEFDAGRAASLAGSIIGDGAAGDKPGRFGLMLIDGLSMLEEHVTANLFTAMGGVPLIGGSAGDDLRFRQTQVFGDGRFRQNAAVFACVETSLPFATFMTQHFRPTDKRLVITEADPLRRRVMEIDGMPASEAYAAALGLAPDQLGPSIFSEHPVLLPRGGEHYVRSIQRVQDDGSLVFYCAIDTGLVLRIGEGVGLEENLGSRLRDLERELGSIELVLGCDCILRRLECQQKQITGRVEQVLRRYPFLGFSTYGEQFNGMHINQTLTGVALGRGRL